MRYLRRTNAVLRLALIDSVDRLTTLLERFAVRMRPG